jgi:hypothetical protein
MLKTVRGALLAAALAFAAPAAMAQTTTPDPAAMTEARALMAKTGADGIARQMLGIMKPQMQMMLLQMNPDKAAAVMAILDLMVAEFELRIPDLVDRSAALYVDQFSLEDLKQLNAFYDSPLGRKLIEKMPALVEQSNVMAQAFASELVRDVARKLAPEFEKRQLKPLPI